MTSPLTGQVVMGPLSFDVPSDYLQLEYHLDTDRLNTTLVKLSQTVSRNAKVTNGMRDELLELRAHVDTSIAKVHRQVALLDDSTRALREQFTRLYDEVRALNGTSVRRPDFDADKAELWSEVKELRSFVAEYQASDGHISRVQSWVKEYLPAWYVDVGNEMQALLDRKTKSSNAALRSEMETDVQALVEAVHTRVRDVSTLVDSRCNRLDTTQKSLSERLADTDAKTHRLTTATSAVSNEVAEVRKLCGGLDAETTAGRAAVLAQHHALLAVLGIRPRDVAQLVDLPATEARLLEQADKERQIKRAAASSSGWQQSLTASGGAGASVVRRANTPGQSNGRSDDANKAPSDDMVASVRTTDGAAVFLRSLAPFQEMSATLERHATDVKQVIGSLRESLHEQIAAKADAASMKSAIAAHKDDYVYRTIDVLLREIQALRVSTPRASGGGGERSVRDGSSVGSHPPTLELQQHQSHRSPRHQGLSSSAAASARAVGDGSPEEGEGLPKPVAASPGTTGGGASVGGWYDASDSVLPLALPPKASASARPTPPTSATTRPVGRRQSTPRGGKTTTPSSRPSQGFPPPKPQQPKVSSSTDTVSASPPPPPRGELPESLGNVLFKMTKEDFQYQQRGDPRLLQSSSPGAQSPRASPPAALSGNQRSSNDVVEHSVNPQGRAARFEKRRGTADSGYSLPPA